MGAQSMCGFVDLASLAARDVDPIRPSELKKKTYVSAGSTSQPVICMLGNISMVTKTEETRQ